MDRPGRSKVPPLIGSRVKPYRVAGAVCRWAKTSNRPRRMERKERDAAKLMVMAELQEVNRGCPLGWTFMSL